MFKNLREMIYQKQIVGLYKNECVRYSPGIPSIHNNTVENFWSVLKQGVYCTCYQIAFKRLQTYCNYLLQLQYKKTEIRRYICLNIGNIEMRLAYKQLVQVKTRPASKQPVKVANNDNNVIKVNATFD